MNPDLYKNKYRIESSRLNHWDYGSNSPYFITICTRNRENLFGEIWDGEMHLSEMGQEPAKYWQKIPEHFPFVILDEFIVMPNHIHGIIIIDKFEDTADSVDAMNLDTINLDAINQDAINRVSTQVTVNGQENRKDGGITGDKNPMIYENLSRILRWYKGRVKFESRNIQADFAWQPRFHDHIIRNERTFEKIKNYIINNPSNWEKDKFYLK